LIVVNAFFVAAEYALVRVRRTRMEALAAQGVVSLSPADNSVGPVWSRLRHINRTVLPSHLGFPRPRPSR
jgi:hypothetical protein